LSFVLLLPNPEEFVFVPKGEGAGTVDMLFPKKGELAGAAEEPQPVEDWVPPKGDGLDAGVAPKGDGLDAGLAPNGDEDGAVGPNPDD
jgi:hypothetical protein